MAKKTKEVEMSKAADEAPLVDLVLAVGQKVEGLDVATKQ